MIDKIALQELLLQGKSHAEIAVIFNCTRPAVSYAAKKLGFVKSNNIDIDKLRAAVESGVSFSGYAKTSGHTLSAISKTAKKHGIVSKSTQHLPKSLPDQTIYDEYYGGSSLHSLHLKYNVPVALIKRRISRVNDKVVFRTMDEIVRPAALNNSTMLAELMKDNSLRQIARQLGVKASTVCAAADKFNLTSKYSVITSDIPDELLASLYDEKLMTPRQIARTLQLSYGVVLRQLRRKGFGIRRVGGEQRPSRHEQLNNHEWLRHHYNDLEWSLADIAEFIGTSVANVSHHCKKHKIVLRTKSEYYKLLMKKSHGRRQVINNIDCDSKLEVEFVKSLFDADQLNLKKNIEFSYGGSWCYIDFELGGELTEIKSTEQSTLAGPDRQRLVKQYLICKNNNRDLKVWNGEYYNLNIEDFDTYYCANWKLLFSDFNQCADWLFSYGFKGVEYARSVLYSGLSRSLRVTPGNELNANYSNQEALKVIKHFSQHYWSSTHKKYSPVTAAWLPGNKSVMVSAVERLWQNESEVNIYGLVKEIARYFKDFVNVSIFKPWIASYIYDRYLPNGGSVVDPCMGWGGRLMGCMDKNISYFGYDLNQNSVDSHVKLRKFINTRIKCNTEFTQADSSICDFRHADLLFTSPPYDDTELYFGVDSIATKTSLILDNIFDKFSGKTIVLNVPRRQEVMCRESADKRGWKYVETLEMKTASFMGREKTFEPILVFKR